MTGTLEGTRTVSHPLYGRIDCAVIGCPAGETEEPDALPADLGRLSPDSVIETALHAGIIDELDGVPLHLKLFPVEGRKAAVASSRMGRNRSPTPPAPGRF